MTRNRFYYFLLILITIGAGLLSRSRFIPECIYPYLGDVLYTVMYYFIAGFMFPTMKPIKVAILSMGFCYAIEFTQLCKADWIMALRSYKLGGLILGYGFRWSDLVCYAIGGFGGMAMEKMCRKSVYLFEQKSGNE
ncbi:MAG: DUF2809 domain-containing protein [Bacteroidia bacterium]